MTTKQNSKQSSPNWLFHKLLQFKQLNCESGRWVTISEYWMWARKKNNLYWIISSEAKKSGIIGRGAIWNWISIEFGLSRFSDRISKALEEGKSISYLLRIFDCWWTEWLDQKGMTFYLELKDESHTVPEVSDSLFSPNGILKMEEVGMQFIRELDPQSPEARVASWIIGETTLDHCIAKTGLKKSKLYSIRKDLLHKIRIHITT